MLIIIVDFCLYFKRKLWIPLSDKAIIMSIHRMVLKKMSKAKEIGM